MGQRNMWSRTRALTKVLCAVSIALAAVPGRVVAADAAFGQYLSSECVTCHRTDGQDVGIPSIVGWPADQFVSVLKSYRNKERSNPIMQSAAGRLSNDEMEALAAYYAALRRVPQGQPCEQQSGAAAAGKPC